MMTIGRETSLIEVHLWTGDFQLVLETGKGKIGSMTREDHLRQGAIVGLPHHLHVADGEEMQEKEVGLLLEILQRIIIESLIWIGEEMIKEGGEGIGWMMHTSYI